MSSGTRGPIVHSNRSSQEGYSYRNGMGMVPCAEFDVLHDDFHQFIVATDITNGPVANTPWGWAGAIIDTGSTVTANATATVGANGVLTFADATLSEGAAIYGTKSFQLISGKKMFIECRMYTNDVTDNAIQFGLSALTAVTNPEDVWTTVATDLVTFGLGDGDSNPKMLVDASNSGTSFQVQTVKGMLTSTWHTLAIYFDGVNLHGFVDGDRALTWGSAASTIPLATALAPFIGHINGNGAGGNVVLIDYFRIVAER